MNRILVVDDDLDILTLVKIMLTMNDFSVEAVSKWQHIDDTIVRFQPDLILLDISLGGADGRDICKKIKQTIHTQHIPVILFSANVEMGSKYQLCHAQDFISKPFDISHLLKTVKLHLN